MSNTSVDKQAIHSRWTADLVEHIPYVEGARIEIIDGQLYVSSVLPNWTTDIVEQMPHVEGERYEIIAGELYVTSRPHSRHQLTTAAICFQLNTWSVANDAGYAFEAPGIVYEKHEAISPDVVWVSKARLDSLIASDGKLHESPELVVEVLSPSTEDNDRTEKLRLYERRSVQEYWVVDWRVASVEIYRRNSEGLNLVETLTIGETLISPLLPGFTCLIDRFFNLLRR